MAKRLHRKPTCHVCAHKDRTLIEAGRVAGTSLDALAARYGVSRDSVHRHCRDHLSDDDRALYLAQVPMAELAAKAAAEGMSLLEYLGLLRGMLMREVQLSLSVHDRHGASALSGRLLETLRQIGQMTGEIRELGSRVTVNNVAVFTRSPEFTRLTEMLLVKLAPHPEALAAVLAGLRELDAETVTPSPALIGGPVIEGEAGHG